MTQRRLLVSVLVALIISVPASIRAQTEPSQTPRADAQAPGLDIPAPPPPRAAQPAARSARPTQAPQASPAVPASPSSPSVDTNGARDADLDDDDFPDDGRDVVRIGQDFTLGAGENARSVVVIMGNATIDGHARSVVVIMGTIRLGPAARVDRELTSIAGGVQVADGASVGREMVVVGGSVDAPPTFTPGGEHVIINPPLFGRNMNTVVSYVTSGLLLGRIIVPSLPWLWGIVGIFLLLYLIINVIADVPVRASVAALDEKLLTSFGAGLLVLLLLAPVSLLLAVSVVGLLVIPVVQCAVFAAALVGKTATLRWLGQRLWRGEQSSAWGSTIAFLIGFVVVTLIYMVPILGLVSFALLSVLGLGAATLAFTAAYRREQPPAPPAPAGPPPMPPGAPPLEPLGGHVAAAVVSDMPTGQVPPLAAPVVYPDAALPRGGFRDRLAAFVLDLILVVLVVQAVWPFRGGRIMFLALLAYHIGFWAWKHTTVGGIICHLRVVRVDGAPLTMADAFIRGLSAIFSVVVLGLGFLWVLRDPDRQSWHDKIAGTYVVKVPRLARV